MPAYINLRNRYFRAKIERLFFLARLDFLLYQPKCNGFLLNNFLAYNPDPKSQTGISQCISATLKWLQRALAMS